MTPLGPTVSRSVQLRITKSDSLNFFMIVVAKKDKETKSFWPFYLVFFHSSITTEWTI